MSSGRSWPEGMYGGLEITTSYGAPSSEKSRTSAHTTSSRCASPSLPHISCAWWHVLDSQTARRCAVSAPLPSHRCRWLCRSTRGSHAAERARWLPSHSRHRGICTEPQPPQAQPARDPQATVELSLGQSGGSSTHFGLWARNQHGCSQVKIDRPEIPVSNDVLQRFSGSSEPKSRSKSDGSNRSILRRLMSSISTCCSWLTCISCSVCRIRCEIERLSSYMTISEPSSCDRHR